MALLTSNDQFSHLRAQLDLHKVTGPLSDLIEQSNQLNPLSGQVADLESPERSWVEYYVTEIAQPLAALIASLENYKSDIKFLKKEQTIENLKQSAANAQNLFYLKLEKNCILGIDDLDNCVAMSALIREPVQRIQQAVEVSHNFLNSETAAVALQNFDILSVYWRSARPAFKAAETQLKQHTEITDLLGQTAWLEQQKKQQISDYCKVERLAMTHISDTLTDSKTHLQNVIAKAQQFNTEKHSVHEKKVFWDDCFAVLNNEAAILSKIGASPDLKHKGIRATIDATFTKPEFDALQQEIVRLKKQSYSIKNALSKLRQIKPAEKKSISLLPQKKKTSFAAKLTLGVATLLVGATAFQFTKTIASQPEKQPVKAHKAATVATQIARLQKAELSKRMTEFKSSWRADKSNPKAIQEWNQIVERYHLKGAPITQALHDYGSRVGAKADGPNDPLINGGKVEKFLAQQKALKL